MISLKSIQNNKTPCNDGLRIEFYETFWIERDKDRDKRYIKNWRPISLLNIDTKIISKALSAKLKKAFPAIISSNQTAYIKKRCFSESGRLISDLIEVCEKQTIAEY